MDPKYFILVLFFGYPNNMFFSNTETITTEKPRSTLFTSPMSYVSADSQNTTGKTLDQPTHFSDISPGQLVSPAKIAKQVTPTISVSSGKPVAHSSARPPAYNITRQPTPTVNISSPLTALPVLTSAKKLPSSAHISTRSPTPSVYPPTEQPPSPVHASSGNPVLPTVGNLSTWPISTIKNLPRNTPGFILETTSGNEVIKKTDYRSIAGIIVGTILIFMLVAIIMIVLWKCSRRPVLNDQNWAGRSPFADGEIPDMCMDNIRENEPATKRTSIVSLMTWKPNKSTLLADDLEVKLFESSENIEDADNPLKEDKKDKINGISEDSADRSTIGTAVSSSDDTDMPLPPPFLDLEGQESNQSDKPTMITLSPLPNESANLQPSLEGVNQACEDPNSDIEQSFPPPPESFNLPLHQEDFVKNQEDSSEMQCQEFSGPPDSAQDLNKSLPTPPAELL
ncbi:PREDICTED: protein EVI2B [Chinchilla lanigera]|uniref:Ecotropic viral integration site 2B n=1 Tax=Chinchilla lanigera TaxID=34839 RepID=A0A8C2W5Z9_CHILA|nr:PREDICTED: protein EVI2B [Chinchilla lanigera]